MGEMALGLRCKWPGNQVFLSCENFMCLNISTPQIFTDKLGKIKGIRSQEFLMKMIFSFIDRGEGREGRS